MSRILSSPSRAAQASCPPRGSHRIASRLPALLLSPTVLDRAAALLFDQHTCNPPFHRCSTDPPVTAHLHHAMLCMPAKFPLHSDSESPSAPNLVFRWLVPTPANGWLRLTANGVAQRPPLKRCLLVLLTVWLPRLRLAVCCVLFHMASLRRPDLHIECCRGH
ncbi:hypothetical protein IWX91DRAFT_335731 [Phyllosticta citricarpa]